MRPESRPHEPGIAILADRQHGVVAHGQLVDLGFGEAAIQRRLAAGRLHRIHRGVYAVGHTSLRREGRLMAAILACGDGAMVSHRSAAVLWGLHRSSRAVIDVTAPRGLRGRPGIVVHRTRSPHPDDRALLHGIPITSVARTLLDLAAVVSRRQLERAVDEAERLRLFDMRAIEELLRRSRGHRGAKRLRAVIADATEPPATRMELERRFAELCRDHELPRPAFNVTVEGFEVDAAWPDRKLIVELDSWTFHGGRNAFEADRERDAALQLAHYRVIRLTWRRLSRQPAGVADDLSRLLRRRGEHALAQGPRMRDNTP